MSAASFTLRCAAAKAARFGLRVSGDSIDLVERPSGGLSLILADGQGHGEAAKRVSGPVVARIASLLADGARDGAAARMAHDVLHHGRSGRVSSTLVILSADAPSEALVVTRSGDSPVYVRRPADADGPDRVERLDDAQPPLGVVRWNRPAVQTYPLVPGAVLLGMSDGVFQTDRERGSVAVADAVGDALRDADPVDVRSLVEAVLRIAVDAASGRPRDDVTVLAMAVGPAPEDSGPASASVRLDLEMRVHA